MALYKGKNLLIDWQDYYQARNAMFAGLEVLMKKNNLKFTHVVTIPCGGMLLGGHTAKRFGDPVDGKLPIGNINVSSYHNGVQGPMKVREVPGFMCNMDIPHQKGCLVVDDMGDSCKTLKWVRETYPAVTIASPWVRYEEMAKGIVDVFGKVLNHDTFLDFPWDHDSLGEGEVFTDQPQIVMDRLQA